MAYFVNIKDHFSNSKFPINASEEEWAKLELKNPIRARIQSVVFAILSFPYTLLSSSMAFADLLCKGIVTFQVQLIKESLILVGANTINIVAQPIFGVIGLFSPKTALYSSAQLFLKMDSNLRFIYSKYSQAEYHQFNINNPLSKRLSAVVESATTSISKILISLFLLTLSPLSGMPSTLLKRSATRFVEGVIIIPMGFKSVFTGESPLLLTTAFKIEERINRYFNGLSCCKSS